MDTVSLHHTPFGLLKISAPEDGGYQATADRISAELRGLDLLEEVVSGTKTWSREVCALTGNTNLVAGLDGFELRIDVVKTILGFLIRRDPHLEVHIHRGRNRSVGTVERVCVLYNMNHPGCAIADALVSLVLLGEANWPDGATPHTLRDFAQAAQIEQRARRLRLGKIDLTLEDIEEIEDIRQALALGIPQAAIDMLCCFCRRCYTCKGMEIEAVKRYTAPLFAEVPPEALVAYAQRPSVPSDLLFLPDDAFGA